MRTACFRLTAMTALAIGAPALAAGGATLEGKLEAIQLDATFFDVQVWARTTNDAASFPLGDGGIKALQFSVKSFGTGLAIPVPAAVTGPNATKVLTAWDPTISTNFTVVNSPIADASPKDGDLDATGAAFFDPNNFAKIDVGLNNTWQLVATERCSSPPPEPESGRNSCWVSATRFITISRPPDRATRRPSHRS